MQRQMIAKKIRFYVIDGYEVAEKSGMGKRINTIMQTCFFCHIRRVASGAGGYRD